MSDSLDALAFKTLATVTSMQFDLLLNEVPSTCFDDLQY